MSKLYYYGIDPASGSGRDYTGIVIHSITSITDDDPRPLPRLANLYQEKLKLTAQLDLLTNELFPKYPPYYICVDYTNEKTFTDMLIRDYGKDVVEGITFGVGTSGTKKMLKDDGVFILREGYKFPNYTTMRDRSKAELLKTLIDELKHEQMKLTPAGKESFDHPTNRHNDIAIAWELSIHACLKFMLNANGEPVATSTDYYKRLTEDEEEYERVAPKYETPEDLLPELTSKRYRIKGVWSSV